MRLSASSRQLWEAGRFRAVRARRSALDLLAGARRQTSGPAVALTFDDGPHPGTTDHVLDLLATHQVEATFFCVGRNAESHPRLLQRIAAEGHAVGSHSWSHPDPERTPLRLLAEDYRRGAEAVSDLLGEAVRLFRPPRGFLDLQRAGQLRRMRMSPWLWSLDPQDWHPDTRASMIIDHAARAQAGDVILLHDWIESPWHKSVLTRAETLSALPQVIESIRTLGLSFTTLG